MATAHISHVFPEFLARLKPTISGLGVKPLTTEVPTMKTIQTNHSVSVQTYQILSAVSPNTTNVLTHYHTMPYFDAQMR